MRKRISMKNSAPRSVDEDVIARTRVHEVFDRDVHFELFREDHEPPLTDLAEGLMTAT